MGIDHARHLRKLAHERDTDSGGGLAFPRWIEEARRYPLRRPLTRVPVGSRIVIELDMPGNTGGSTCNLGGFFDADDCVDIATARQTIMELVRLFLDHNLPLPA
jgi:hypothetical protein